MDPRAFVLRDWLKNQTRSAHKSTLHPLLETINNRFSDKHKQLFALLGKSLTNKMQSFQTFKKDQSKGDGHDKHIQQPKDKGAFQ